MIETLYGISTLLFCVVFLLGTSHSYGGEMYGDGDSWTTAWVNITYKHPQTGQIVSEKDESGHYGSGPIRSVKGWLVHTKPKDGCSRLQNDFSMTKSPWIALVSRGNCTFTDKVGNASAFNASGVVVYNNAENAELSKMSYTGDLTAIIISLEDGTHITSLLDNGTKVYIDITIGTRTIQRVRVSKTSVLFVSISFIVLMVISLAWLVFYYIQRFRYAHARDKSQKRLGRAAKKAISKLRQRTLKENDPETHGDVECCAVCIEHYKVGDVIRKLPCKHYFHKGCVDQWLIEHRTCPMCKLNILKALGHDSQDSQDSLAVDVEVAVTTSNNGNETEEESIGNEEQTSVGNTEQRVASSTSAAATTQQSASTTVDLEATCQDDSPEGIQNLMLVWVPEDVGPVSHGRNYSNPLETDGPDGWDIVGMPTEGNSEIPGTVSGVTRNVTT
ncbi:RING finger protein 150-like [Ptychodera flava]|uniref:RING finger protein 150-like n=1 Tax=Ptychodera flava TaxID=63121 RepID=UPI00396A4111